MRINYFIHKTFLASFIIINLLHCDRNMECESHKDCAKGEMCIQSGDWFDSWSKCKKNISKKCNIDSDCKSCYKNNTSVEKWVCYKNYCLDDNNVGHDKNAGWFDYIYEKCPEVNGSCANTDTNECRDTYQADCKDDNEEFAKNEKCPATGICVDTVASECTQTTAADCTGDNMRFTAGASCPE